MAIKKLNNFIILICFSYIIKAQNTSINSQHTIFNQTDTAGKKQGYWIVYGKDKFGTCYKSNQKIEEGKYKDNCKYGVWKEYYCNDSLKSLIPYVDGKAEGNVKCFFDNGKISAVGTWKNNRYVGNYKEYYSNGNMREEGDWLNNSKCRIRKQYYENGKLSQVCFYNEKNRVDSANFYNIPPYKITINGDTIKRNPYDFEKIIKQIDEKGDTNFIYYYRERDIYLYPPNYFHRKTRYFPN